jgi:hypothetical protein
MSLADQFKALAHGAGEHKTELAGLGALMAPSVDELQAHARAAAAGEYNKPGVEKRTVLPHVAKPLIETVGLGGLMIPPAVNLLTHKTAMAACLDELTKLGAISDDEARRSIDRLENLEQSTPTGGQVARYGALGAGTGALMHAVGRGIEGAPITRRSLGGAAATGTLGLAALPLVRAGLDRTMEKRKLQSYLAQEHVGNYGKNPNPEPAAAAPLNEGFQKV